jgi:predicted dehydrogenase
MASCVSLAPNARPYASVDELLDSHSVEAVVISLPSHLHTYAAIAAFRRGAHVYLEKPVASRMDDGRRIVEAWRDSNRIGMIGQNFRFNPLAKKMKDSIVSGSVGKVRSIVTKYSTPRPPQESWRRSRETGGGALLDLAVHHIDFARFALASEIATVSARIESRESDHDSGALSLTFENGATATIEVAFGESFQDRIEARGDAGTLWIDRTHSVDVGRAAAAGRIGLMSTVRAHLPTPGRIRYWALRRQSPFHEPSYAIALSAFVQAAASGAHPSPDLDDGLAALAAVEAAEKSSSSGQPVTMGSAGMSLA